MRLLSSSTGTATITGGTINGATIGATTQANAQFFTPVNAQTGTTYTLAASDCAKFITLSNASAITLTLPQQSTTATTVGFWCRVRNIGVGTVTIVKEGAETLTGNVTLATNAEVYIFRPATTAWTTFGGTATVTFSFEKTFQAVADTNVRYFTVAAPCAGTIIDCSQVAASLGTAGTYTVAINGVDVTGLSAITNTTTKTTTAASAANTFAYGDYITVTFASIVAGVNWEGTLRYTRAL